jgi:hypothetical protein
VQRSRQTHTHLVDGCVLVCTFCCGVSTAAPGNELSANTRYTKEKLLSTRYKEQARKQGSKEARKQGSKEAGNRSRDTPADRRWYAVHCGNGPSIALAASSMAPSEKPSKTTSGPSRCRGRSFGSGKQVSRVTWAHTGEGNLSGSVDVPAGFLSTSSASPKPARAVEPCGCTSGTAPCSTNVNARPWVNVTRTYASRLPSALPAASVTGVDASSPPGAAVDRQGLHIETRAPGKTHGQWRNTRRFPSQNGVWVRTGKPRKRAKNSHAHTHQLTPRIGTPRRQQWARRQLCGRLPHLPARERCMRDTDP